MKPFKDQPIARSGDAATTRRYSQVAETVLNESTLSVCLALAVATPLPGPAVIAAEFDVAGLRVPTTSI